MTSAWRLSWLLFGCVLLALAGCGRDESGPSGVAATVNGEPIAVADLEARHDMARVGLPDAADNPSVERLRDEYGEVLGGMIVARLAGQELAKRQAAVTDAEVAAAEAAVRADYPGEAFATMLLEEHIDLARWRAALRDRLTVDKFCREVLRPGLRVEVTEAADYYKSHIETFTRPERTRFALVRSKNAETARAAQAAYRKGGSREDLAGKPGLAVQEVSLADRNLPKAWREALRPLKVGEASAVLPDDAGSAFLILLERQGESVVDPAKAYAAVEAILMADKQERAFADWLAASLASATIQVNTVLATGQAQPVPAGEASQAAAEQPAPTAEKPAPSTAATASPTAASAPTTAGPAPTAPEAAPAAPEIAAAPGREALQPPATAKPVGPVEPGTAKGPAPTGAPAAPAASATVTAPAEPTPAPVATAEATPPPAESVAPAASVTPPPDTASATPASETPAATEAASAATASAPAAPAAAPAPAAPETSPVEAAATSAEGAPTPPTPTAPETSPVEAAATSAEGAPTPPTPTAAPSAPAAAQGGEVEFTAIKASWILYTVDEGKEERVYLKPGKPQTLAFTKHLSVRLGTPSEVSYRYAGREIRVEVPKKESKVLEFP